MRKDYAKNKKGVVLVITLAVIVILTVIVLEFNYASRVDLNISSNFRNDLRAEYLAKSGLNFAIFLLRKDEDFSMDVLDDDWAKEFPAAAVFAGKVSLKITDEDRKLNINQAAKDEESKQQIERLFQSLGESIAGLEDISEGAPYETMGQWMKGKYDNVSPYVTVSTEGKVNINTAPLEVLMALSPLIDTDIARNIIDFRKENPFEDITQLSPAYEYDKPQGITDEIFNEIKNYIAVRSTVFLVEVKVGVDENFKRIQALVRREGKKCGILCWKDLSYE